MRGRLAEAAKVLDAGVEAARLAGITQSRPGCCATARCSRSPSATCAGARLAEEALELTDQLDESVLTAWAAMSVARAAVIGGTRRRAVDVLDRRTALAARSRASGG